MPLALPTSADQLDITRWEAIEPYYRQLLDQPLPDVAAAPSQSASNGQAAPPDPVRAWLTDWSRLSELVTESAALLSIAYTQDTEDPARKDAYLHYVREIGPRLRVADQKLKEKLLASGWDAPELATTVHQFRVDAGIFRDDNVPLLAEEQAVAARYSELMGGLTVEFGGATLTLAQLAPYRAAQARAVREAAWRSGMERMLAVRGELDELFDTLLALRLKIAANAGFQNYRDYKWQQLGRFDYSPEDAATFREAIYATVVPALERQSERRAKALGLDGPAGPLRPWDTDVDPHGSEQLRPFGTGQELAEGSIRIFRQLDPELGGMVETMQEEGLLDLDNRKGKAPGGYCASLLARGRPFIFMNAVGTEDNVRTMLHEAGHAFHVFDRNPLPFIWQRRSPMEFAEVASMSMELLTMPYIESRSGGFYTPAEALRANIEQLERIVSFLPYMATVDAFQDWLYAQPVHTREERDAAWLGLHQRFCVGTDWTGFEDSRMSLWHHKQHIFQSPFYYIEYGIAQIGALQVWRNSLADAPGALSHYRRALALGGTVPLNELFGAAGARLAFDAGMVGELVTLIEHEIDRLQAQLAELS